MSTVPLAKVVEQDNQDEASTTFLQIRSVIGNMSQNIIDRAFKDALKAETPFILFVHNTGLQISYSSSTRNYGFVYGFSKKDNVMFLRICEDGGFIKDKLYYYHTPQYIVSRTIMCLRVEFSMNPDIFSAYLKNHAIKNEYQCINIVGSNSYCFCNLSEIDDKTEKNWKNCIPNYERFMKDVEDRKNKIQEEKEKCEEKFKFCTIC